MKCEIPDIIPYQNSKMIQTYQIGNTEIKLTVSGVGQENARDAAKKLCLENDVDLVIFLGFCGGTKTRLKIGDLIIAEKVHYNGGEISLNPSKIEEVKKCLSKQLLNYYTGKLQTFNRSVISNEKVLDDVIGVDMESYMVAQEADKYNIPSIIVRSVSDIIPDKKPLLFPRLRLIFNMFRNLKIAKKSLNDFFKIYFLY